MVLFVLSGMIGVSEAASLASEAKEIATDSPKTAVTGDGPLVPVTKAISYVMKHFSREMAAPRVFVNAASETAAASGSVISTETSAISESPSPAEIKIEYPEFQSSGEKNAAVDAINAFIFQKLTIQEEGKYASSVVQVIDVFMDDFQATLKENPDMPGGWSRDLSLKVRYADENLLSLEIVDSSFTGGNHPNTNIEYVVLSMKTGSPIKLAEFVPAAKMKELTKIAEEYFREAHEMKSTDSFEEVGFTFDKNTFALNENFLVWKDGLEFYFNPYEVAAYVVGPTLVLVPWTKLADIADAKGPAGAFLER